ncbi:10587_t:CDS:10 [Acaulospora morrowiae]|uniref:10587_t:CDS:1 n=1 Tax=Acaulospora morrowiae TaxID=94023 RepID=A0A9N9H463_9GLOM|nr:10587_t:CDS:10 [Acaulospora morrowiae]
MPRRGYIEDDLDSSNESEGESFNISDSLLAEEAELFENPLRHHKRRKFTKEEAYLGIWAEDNEEDTSIYRKKSEMQFISSESSNAIKEATVDKEIHEDSSDDSINEDYKEIEMDEEPESEGYGGLGFGSQRVDMEEEQKLGLGAGLDNGKDTESAILDDMINMQFGSTKNKKKKFQTNSRQNIRPEETIKHTRNVDKNFGKFEQHTRGIGLKLMQKMGYKIGEGLGTEGKGIVNPIETKIRPSKMGLAYRGFDEKTDQVKKGEIKQGSTGNDKDEKVPKEKKNAWKKSSKQKKTKTEYKTADEIIDETTSAAPQPMKIIDMTGPQARELSSANQIKSHAILDESSRLPELRHNLRLIVDMSKSDLEHFTRELRIQSEKKKSLEQEMTKISTLIEDEAIRINRLGEMISIIKDCNELLTNALSVDSPELHIFSDHFRRLQTEYLDEFITYGLDSAVVSIISPVFKRYLANWDPLENPKLGIHEFQQWNSLFKITKTPPKNNLKNYNDASNSSELTMTPYESMMYSVWLPKVRSAINNSWNARDFDPVIRLLENWNPLLPVFICDNITNQLIMPKLMREVDMWNPKTDTGMIHQWLHPWLPLLGERMDPLYVTIRQKFRLILQNWDPTDSLAFAILKPWKNVLQPADMQSLLAKSILPKLSEMIRTRFHINPRKQELDLFYCVMKWQHMFTLNVFSKLFESEFFPKWLDALYTWLTNRPKYDEIRQWYMFWKSMFPPDMLANHVIETQFTKGLSLIEESISLGKESIDRLSHPSKQQNPNLDSFQHSFSKISHTIDNEEITFFDLVEEFAQENNLLFLPTNKTHKASGKPIYRMGGTPEGTGGITLYLQDDVMFVKNEQDWLPMGFDEILGII